MRWRQGVAVAKLALLRALLKVTPAFNHAVVTGFPDDEGNSVEMVRSLSSRLPVYWLTSDDPGAVDWLLPQTEPQFPIRRLRKDSLPAYLAYLTARFVFFTHGLYGSPPPPRHKAFVNLWHGDGPKRSKRFAYIRSTYAVAGTQTWGRQRPVYFGVREEGVLVTGNPRIDQFARPTGDEALRTLGVDPQTRLVLWMPTYRRTEYRGRRLAGVRNWADAHELSEVEAVRRLFEKVGRAAVDRGISLVVKPHPLDADHYASLGLQVITGEDLGRARTTVYELLGRSHGLITDYSSVWTDYLAMDRPIGLHCPDIEEYEETRGLNVDNYRDLVPGPFLQTLEDFERFLDDCLTESSESRDQRARSVEAVGAETRLGAGERLLEALSITRPAEELQARPASPAAGVMSRMIGTGRR